STDGDAYVVATLLFREYCLQLHRVGDRHVAIHLAATSPPATVRGAAASSHPAQLPLRRLGVPGPGRRIARSAVRLRACRRLRGYRCGDTRVAFAGIAVTWSWRRHRMELQSLGLSRSPERLLPGQ